MPVYSLQGKAPQLPSSHWLAPDCHLIGDLLIGEDVGIWFGAVLRGDNERISIGARSNIQEHAVLHTDIGFSLAVGEDCTVGHRAILHGCTIGSGSLIGMGATILNGARIGAGSLVGANALVTEGKQFEPGSLIVGSPAKAIRVLGTDEQQRLILSAANYVKNWRRFASGLVRIN